MGNGSIHDVRTYSYKVANKFENLSTKLPEFSIDNIRKTYRKASKKAIVDVDGLITISL